MEKNRRARTKQAGEVERKCNKTRKREKRKGGEERRGGISVE